MFMQAIGIGMWLICGVGFVATIRYLRTAPHVVDFRADPIAWRAFWLPPPMLTPV